MATRNDVRNADLLERYNSGETLDNIAKQIGLTRQRVAQIINAASALSGIPKRSWRPKKTPAPRFRLTDQQVHDFLHGQETAQSLREKLGCGLQALLRLLRQRGVSKRQVQDEKLGKLYQKFMAGQTMNELLTESGYQSRGAFSVGLLRYRRQHDLPPKNKIVRHCAPKVAELYQKYLSGKTMKELLPESGYSSQHTLMFAFRRHRELSGMPYKQQKQAVDFIKSQGLEGQYQQFCLGDNKLPDER